ncbi:MAG: aspartate kinase [Bacteroidales bacterium]|nr:aspartate kinase [Candidatus Cryptobacteroides aphodequi]
MRVLKFGGSSVATATAISQTLDTVLEAAKGDRVVLICSAIKGCTDALIAASSLEGEERTAAIGALSDQHALIVRRLFTGAERERLDEVMDDLFEDLAAAPSEDFQTFGELFSTRIIAQKLFCEGVNSLWLDSRDLIRTRDGQVVVEDSYRRIRQAVAAHPQVRIFVAPGFIARDERGHVTTLGRGGSDYSAALYAAALDAASLQIWTDVPGIMTANPKDVHSALTVKSMSYEAAFSLAKNGAKVLYPPTVIPAAEAGIDIEIRNTFAPAGAYTVIGSEPCGNWVGVTSAEGRITLVADYPFPVSSTLARVRSVLASEGIPVRSISVLDDGVQVEVAPQLGSAALKSVHKEFFERDSKGVIDLYVAGTGAVGSALVELVRQNSARLAEKTGKTLRIAHCVSHEAEDEEFFAKLLKEAPRHSIFIDCTDSETIWKWYSPLLEAGIDVVSANRRSLAVPYVNYREMKASALSEGTFLRYETTVGAALPILDSLARCANSSDEIISLEAVVSCTLNKILTSSDPFPEALRKAQEAGLTEKDPSADLSGRDALRKLLILAREAGIALEESDVEVIPVKGNETFTKGSRFVASLVKDAARPLGYRARIALETVPEDHPAYSLQGTENMIIIRGEFHPSPLIIRGAGEGARQAASSLLNDILR